jgi:hypothetical protein
VGIKKNEWVAYTPDAQVMIRGGDVSLPAQYVELNQAMAYEGYREGQMYQGGMFIMRFMPGVAFASQYVQMKFGATVAIHNGCFRETAPTLFSSWLSKGLCCRLSHDGGRGRFFLSDQQPPYIGYVFAETSAAPSMGVATVWSSRTLYGFLAPANRALEADAVLHRAVRSLSINPRWAAREEEWKRVC